MTENEVIKIIGNNATEKEIILKTLYQLVEKFNRGHWGDIQLFEDEENRYSTVIEKVIEEIQQYRAIGTVEELKELKEKAEPKKPQKSGVTDNKGIFHATNGINGVPYDLCPNCEINLCTDGRFGRDKNTMKYCKNCGQKLDWE